MRKIGFTLIEILLVIGVMMIMSIIKIRDINDETEDIQAKMLAGQIETVSNATNAFIVLKYNDLAELSKSLCNTSNQTCSITLQQLNDNALLPPNFSSTTILGQPYEIQLKRTGSSPNYMISGLVLTKGNKNTENKMSLIFSGKVLRDIGRDGGLNKNNGKIIGTSNGWNADSTLFPILSGKTGYVGSAVGTLSGAYYVYLRRDGSLPMTGDLNMDGHNIKNVNNLTATGALTTTGNISGSNILATKNVNVAGNVTANGTINSGGWVNAKNGYGDGIEIGGDGVGGANADYEIRLNSNKTLTIYSPTHTPGSIVFNVNGSQRINESLKVDKDITVSGNIVSSANVKGNTLESAGRTTTGEFMQINGKATVGAKCSPNGLQGRTLEGALISCVSGVWTKNGGSVASLSVNGWTRDESTGIIQEWAKGTQVCRENDNRNVVFPIVFPHSVFNVQVTALLSGGGEAGDFFFQIKNVNNNYVTVVPNGNTYGSCITPYIRAIGY